MGYETMTRRRIQALALTSMIFAASLGSTADEAGFAKSRHGLDIESFDYVWATIRDRHFDPALGGLDWEGVRRELRPRVEVARSTEEAREIMDEMIGRLGQSHFAIIPAEFLDEMGAPTVDSAFAGETGIAARLIGGRVIVTSVREGTPAHEAGVSPGWEILAIRGEELSPKIARLLSAFEGRSWKGAALASFIQDQLSGCIGDGIKIGFRDEGDREVEIQMLLGEPRGRACSFGPVRGIRVWFESRQLDGDIGYIAFNHFLDPANTMPRFNEAMNSFLDKKGVVIDLRGNPGGDVRLVGGMAGWFLEDGGHYLGTLLFRESSLKVMTYPRFPAFGGPLAVLIDEVSGSGSELFAGGMQDLKRARIFGVRSSGSVLGSQLEVLPNGDVFQFAFANYISAGGCELEGIGVTPDQVVPTTREALLAGKDAALDEAVEWIEKSNIEKATQYREADR